MQRSDFRFLERLRVRWAEIDAQQIVFNGHYLMYFDTAVAGYWRALAMPYAETMDELGGDLFVRKATLEYHGSARYDDVLDIGMRCARIGNSSMRVRRPACSARTQLLVSGELVYVFADPSDTDLAAGAARAARAVRGLRGRRADGRRARRHAGASSAPARPIRTAGVRRRAEDPGRDGMGRRRCRRVHAVAFNRLGRALAHRPAARACARRRQDRPHGGGQRARGTAASAAPCSTRCSTRRARAATARRCCTRSSARRRSTSAPASCRRGPEFDEAGIAHVEMLRVL